MNFITMTSDMTRAIHEAGHMVAAFHSPFHELVSVDIEYGVSRSGKETGGYAQSSHYFLPGEFEAKGMTLPDGTVIKTPPEGFALKIVEDKDKPELIRHRILVALAGPVAEALFLKQSVSEVMLLDWLRREEFDDDKDPFAMHCIEATDEKKGYLILHLALETRDFLEANWPAVRALAKKLVTKRKLTGEEAWEIISQENLRRMRNEGK